jgi:hypothetical protein
MCSTRFPQVENASFQANAACPPASMPATLASAYYAYQKTWNQDFIKAVAKFDREEANQIAANEARAEAEARRAEREAEKAARLAANGGQAPAVPVLGLFSAGNPLKALVPGSQPAAANGNAQQAASQATQTEAGAGQAAAAGAAADVPVPTPNPEISPQVANAGSAPAAQSDKPFWKIWSSN